MAKLSSQQKLQTLQKEAFTDTIRELRSELEQQKEAR